MNRTHLTTVKLRQSVDAPDLFAGRTRTALQRVWHFGAALTRLKSDLRVVAKPSSDKLGQWIDFDLVETGGLKHVGYMAHHGTITRDLKNIRPSARPFAARCYVKNNEPAAARLPEAIS